MQQLNSVRAISAEFGFQVDLRACTELMKDGSKSFFAASKILPSNIRNSATALYAFCRLLDDLVDDRAASNDVIPQIQDRLNRIYCQEPIDVPADRALALVVERFDVPKILLEALIEGFQWDRDGRRYETLEDLNAYGARVASTVGVMMTLIMGVRDPVVLQRACELGLAMQLTNIARDVGEDARNGRLYLPRAWMREAGIDPDAWLQNPVFSEELGSVVSRLLKTADTMYQRSISGVAGLPRNCRAAISAARLIYCQIGREVERCGMNSVNHRAVVSFTRKMLLMGQALTAGIYSPKSQTPLEPIAELQFLVAAVLPSDPHAHYEGSIEDRMIWVINLMERVEQRRIKNYDAFMQPEKVAA